MNTVESLPVNMVKDVYEAASGCSNRKLYSSQLNHKGIYSSTECLEVSRLQTNEFSVSVIFLFKSFSSALFKMLTYPQVGLLRVYKMVATSAWGIILVCYLSLEEVGSETTYLTLKHHSPL